MSALVRLITFPIFAMVAAVIFVIFLGMCMRAVWDLLRSRF